MKSKRGMTLIELIVSMAIIVVVFAMATTMNVFGTRTYVNGRTEYDVQFDTRMLGEFISNEVRNATSIKLSAPTDAANYKRIFLNTGSHSASFSNAGTTVIKSGPIFLTNSDFNISIIKENNKYFLEYRLNGRNNNQSQLITSKVLLNNIKSLDASSILTNMQEVYYRTSYNISSPANPDWDIISANPTVTPTPTPSPSPTPTLPPSATPTVTPTPDPRIYDVNFKFDKLNTFDYRIWTDAARTNLYAEGNGNQGILNDMPNFAEGIFYFRFYKNINTGNYRDHTVTIPLDDEDNDKVINVFIDY